MGFYHESIKQTFRNCTLAATIGTCRYFHLPRIPKIAMAGDMAAAMGMPTFMVLMLGFIEIGGSLLLLWGGFGPDWATRVAGILFTIVMIGAIAMVHAQYGWNSINMGDNGGRGMEFQVLIIATSLLYVFKGNALNRGVEKLSEKNHKVRRERFD